ncbi:MAG: methylated-DNA--[protein]-cysteine S-methyltransferase [Proteobacteria bacterium]|nr:methylated-DNA--[protein]-cysteine S-methyltransferase [Pseudomonadota bacterium]
MQIIWIEGHTVRGVGRIWAARSKKGLLIISLSGGMKALLHRLPRDAKIVRDAERFRKFFHAIDMGSGFTFKGALDLRGTEFQKRVWRAIATIPRGQTRSYAWLAKKAGRPRAARAAASACGANPLPLLIPCHRVIAGSGTLGGFSGGPTLKRKLLMLEGVLVK